MSLSTTPSSIRWDRLSQAAAFAFRIHAEQTRKGAETPYVAHLMGVASLVLEHGGDEEQAIAALLHDAIEDQGAAQADPIRKGFGERVLTIVRGCTDAEVHPKPPWWARKQSYLKHLEHASPDILLVSCADKLYNARSIRSDYAAIGEAVFARFTAGREGTLWYYGTLADSFTRLLPGPLSAELAWTVDGMAVGFAAPRAP